MADRMEIKNRLRAKLHQRKKEEMETDTKSEMLENNPTTQRIVATTEDADPDNGDMHPVRLKLGYGPDGKPINATLEIGVPEDDQTAAEFISRENVKSDIAKANEEGHTVKILQKEGIQMTVHTDGDIGETAMKQILETIKRKQIPGIDGLFNSEDTGDLAKRLSDSVPRCSKSGPSLEEKVATIKAKMAERRKSELRKKSAIVEQERGPSEPKKIPVASEEDLNNALISLPQPPAELIQKAPKKKNKKISPSMISCDNAISSDINNGAKVVVLLPKKTEEEKEKAAKEKAKEEFLKCSVRNGKYPSTFDEHYEFVKKTFEYLKTNMVQKAE